MIRYRAQIWKTLYNKATLQLSDEAQLQRCLYGVVCHFTITFPTRLRG